MIRWLKEYGNLYSALMVVMCYLAMGANDCGDVFNPFQYGGCFAEEEPNVCGRHIDFWHWQGTPGSTPNGEVACCYEEPGEGGNWAYSDPFAPGSIGVLWGNRLTRCVYPDCAPNQVTTHDNPCFCGPGRASTADSRCDEKNGLQCWGNGQGGSWYFIPNPNINDGLMFPFAATSWAKCAPPPDLFADDPQDRKDCSNAPN